ncbi:MAG TPA: hypothetical protein VJH05_01120 [Candidatus Paceibacterota bacterium]
MKTFIIDTNQGFSLDLNAHVVKELNSREETLNFILKNSAGEDVLIFGDDIILTPGWFLALENNKEKGDIIGFSSLYPDKDIIQDAGYDLAEIDGKISLFAQNRGKKLEEVLNFEARECDALNGCAMFIKKEVIEKIPTFSVEGKNRWGEFLYTNEAKKRGFKVCVLGHFLRHHGKGTKNNTDKSLSSESYMLEQGMWGEIVKKYIDSACVKIHLKKVLSENLKNFFSGNKKILIYGAGTVSEFIYNELKNKIDFSGVDFCSGFPEEKGKIFCGKEIRFYKDADFSKYEVVLISVLGKEKEIFELIKNRITSQNVFCVFQKVIDNAMVWDTQLLGLNLVT